MASSQAKPVQSSLAMIGFSSDKINILQHMKYLFRTIALVTGVLDGMNIVICFIWSVIWVFFVLRDHSENITGGWCGGGGFF